MNAPVGMLARYNREAVEHLAQDLRADAHTAPPNAAALMRQAAVVCDAYVALRVAVGDALDDDDVRPAPIPPPSEDS